MEKKFCYFPVKSKKNLTIVKGFCPSVCDTLEDALKLAVEYKFNVSRYLGKKYFFVVCPFVDGSCLVSERFVVL